MPALRQCPTHRHRSDAHYAAMPNQPKTPMSIPEPTQLHLPIKDLVKSYLHEDEPIGARTSERPQKRPFAASKVMLKEALQHSNESFAIAFALKVARQKA